MIHLRQPLFCLVCVLVCAGSFSAVSAEKVDDGMKVAPTDWPWWRGTERAGVAPADQQPPTKWSATENVIWKASVPGRGHSSPTVVGDCIYLTTCEEAEGNQFVLCYGRNNGARLWQTEVHHGGGMKKNEKSSAASSTVACDGQRLFITFANKGAVFATALSLEGKQLWQTKLCDYRIHQGYGSSPAIYQGLVIVSADHHGGGAIAALERESGKEVWRHERPKNPNYASPIILHVAGRDQVLLTGCDLLSSFEPLTGKKLWEVPGATTECVTSTVTDGKRVYSSGGYPRNHISAVLADGSGKLSWENENRVYVPSLVIREGHLYGTLDAGTAACWEADTGKEKWKARLGGTFSSSPVLVGDLVYATNEEGQTFIFRARPAKFEKVAENKLGDEVFATPAICGNRIYTRIAERASSGRQEYLYCLGGAGEKK